MYSNQNNVTQKDEIREKKVNVLHSIQESIIYEKQPMENQPSKKGPTVDYFFHELARDESRLQRMTDIVVGLISFIFFIITYPIIGLLIKLTSKGPVLEKVKCPGFRGIIFNLYTYRIHPSTDKVNSNQYALKSFTSLGKILHSLRLDKLPASINLLNGDIRLVGPVIFPEMRSYELNSHYTDFFKRYALKPGLFSPSLHRIDELIEYDASDLKKDLNYVQFPTFKKNLKIIIKHLI